MFKFLFILQIYRRAITVFLEKKELVEGFIMWEF